MLYDVAAAMSATPTSASVQGEPLLEAIQVRKEFGGLVAVNDVDFTIPRGSIVSLIGPNGAGKTTFFNILTGRLQADRGRGRLRGHVDITALPPHQITPLGMARTFQNIRLFHNMTDARERARRHAHADQGRRLGLDLRHDARIEREEERGARSARASCSTTRGCAARTNEFAKNLPYGDQRRLEVARALATEPSCCCSTSRPPA